jgi:hypothetical protein
MPSDIFDFATVKMDLKYKMYVDNILLVLNACFEFVLKYVALLDVLYCFSVYVDPYFSEINGKNNILEEIKLDA